ncbi:MAG TPA: response regulator transcription factor [Pseudolysinimonas sp.]|nr:response regulator transcription factor [Pseudolysinimonas sp.]
MTSVVIADDQQLVRAGFRLILDLEPGIEVVGEAGDGAECLEIVARTHPDVVLMDVQMPGVDGIEATRALVAAGSRSRVLILTTFDIDEYVFEGLRAGASGFLLKDVPRAQLVAAVESVARGETPLASSVTRRLIERFVRTPPATSPTATRIWALSARERQVLELLATGMTNAEIAKRLFVGEATVKTHVARLLPKIGARDRIQATIFAYESGFISPSNPAT